MPHKRVECCFYTVLTHDNQLKQQSHTPYFCCVSLNAKFTVPNSNFITTAWSRYGPCGARAQNSVLGCFESLGIGTTPTVAGWHHEGAQYKCRPGNTEQQPWHLLCQNRQRNAKMVSPPCSFEKYIWFCLNWNMLELDSHIHWKPILLY